VGFGEYIAGLDLRRVARHCKHGLPHCTRLCPYVRRLKILFIGQTGDKPQRFDY
jgi:hypothetical protein